MADSNNPSKTRAGGKNNPIIEAIRTTASSKNVNVPVTQITEDLNQKKDEVGPSTVLWIRIEKADLKRLGRVTDRCGWHLMVVTGTVTEQSDPKVNIRFLRKAAGDQEFGVTLLPNHAWEIQSIIQTEAASSARLNRVQDKNHAHNKLTRIILGQAYETTTVEVAADTLEQASEEALNIAKSPQHLLTTCHNWTPVAFLHPTILCHSKIQRARKVIP